MTDDELLARFAANTLPAFPHEEHLRVAFVKTARATTDETIAFMRDGIRRMAASIGAPQKYHETRTVAWVRLVAAARAGFEGDFDSFLTVHPELVRRDLLTDYYSPELLDSDAARAEFVPPDRSALPG